MALKKGILAFKWGLRMGLLCSGFVWMSMTSIVLMAKRHEDLSSSFGIFPVSGMHITLTSLHEYGMHRMAKLVLTKSPFFTSRFEWYK